MPAAGLKGRSTFAVENVCDYLAVAHFFCYPCGAGIEKTAHVRRSIAAEPNDLYGFSVVKHTTHRTGKLYNADKFTVRFAAYAEFVTVYAVMVAVELVYKGVCLFKFKRNRFQDHFSAEKAHGYRSAAAFLRQTFHIQRHTGLRK